MVTGGKSKIIVISEPSDTSKEDKKRSPSSHSATSGRKMGQVQPKFWLLIAKYFTEWQKLLELEIEVRPSLAQLYFQTP